MSDAWRDRLHPVRVGVALSLVAVLGGWGLGIVFGAGEEWLREGTLRRAEAVHALYLERARGDEAAASALIQRMDETCWRYFQRAHLHAGGIGSIALGACLLVSLLSLADGQKAVVGLLLGFGSVAYPLFWMLAALRAPSLGSTALAKESLRWLAMPAAGALVAGASLLLFFFISELWLRSGPSAAGGSR